jgi:citrate lyase subunit alpha/citrate CoA-transferase
MLNAIGRELPERVDGYGRVIPFAGAFAAWPTTRRHAPPVKTVSPGESKVVGDIGEALEKVGIRDGMTLSFHHHLRNGDGVINAVIHTASELGVKDLKVALSSVSPVHAPMVEHFESGVVTALDTDYLSGPVAEAVSPGALARPIVLRTHGGRASRDRVRSTVNKLDCVILGATQVDTNFNINVVTGSDGTIMGVRGVTVTPLPGPS